MVGIGLSAYCGQILAMQPCVKAKPFQFGSCELWFSPGFSRPAARSDGLGTAQLVCGYLGRGVVRVDELDLVIQSVTP